MEDMYPKQNEFKKWLENNDKSLKYEGYITALKRDLFDKIEGINFMSVCIDKKGVRLKEHLEGLIEITRLASTGLYEEFRDVECSLSSLISYKTALNAYKTFIISKNKEEKARYTNVLNNYNKLTPKKKDGTTSLLEILGDNDFVAKVLENSYFFSADMVKKNIDNLANKINNPQNITQPLAARWTEKLYKGVKKDDYKGKNQKQLNQQNKQCLIFESDLGGDNFSSPVLIDYDGNRYVRELINDITGYKVSQGKSSDFLNYKISHIWGRAFDPRYFTSLWNIVLVPAWANDLLDKMDTNQKIVKKLINTFMKVCYIQYNMNSLKWEEIKMDKPEILFEDDDDCDKVVPDNGYTINVFENRNMKTNDPSQIIKKKISKDSSGKITIEDIKN